MSKLIGKPTINLFAFFSGKISAYITWIVFFFQFNTNLNHIQNIELIIIISYIIFVAGIILSIISLFNLGSSTSLGIPNDQTEFKTNGLYKISRNPMYLGFNLLSIASILHTMNFIVLALCIFSIITHHLIILGEEKFLSARFKKDYEKYCSRVRRYF